MSAGQRENSEIVDLKNQFIYEATAKSFGTLSPMSSDAWLVLSPDEKENYVSQMKEMHENDQFRTLAQNAAAERMYEKYKGGLGDLSKNVAVRGLKSTFIHESPNGQWWNSDIKTADGKIVARKGDVITNGTGDWGSGQINEKTWGNTYDMERVKDDLFYNLQSSAEIYGQGLTRAKADYDAMKPSSTLVLNSRLGLFNSEETFKKKDMDILRMAYAQYNRGNYVILNPEKVDLKDFAKNKVFEMMIYEKNAYLSSSFRPYIGSNYLHTNERPFLKNDADYLKNLKGFK